MLYASWRYCMSTSQTKPCKWRTFSSCRILLNLLSLLLLLLLFFQLYASVSIIGSSEWINQRFFISVNQTLNNSRNSCAFLTIWRHHQTPGVHAFWSVFKIQIFVTKCCHCVPHECLFTSTSCDLLRLITCMWPLNLISFGHNLKWTCYKDSQVTLFSVSPFFFSRFDLI